MRQHCTTPAIMSPLAPKSPPDAHIQAATRRRAADAACLAGFKNPFCCIVYYTHMSYTHGIKIKITTYTQTFINNKQI